MTCWCPVVLESPGNSKIRAFWKRASSVATKFAEGYCVWPYRIRQLFDWGLGHFFVHHSCSLTCRLRSLYSTCIAYTDEVSILEWKERFIFVNTKSKLPYYWVISIYSFYRSHTLTYININIYIYIYDIHQIILAYCLHWFLFNSSAPLRHRGGFHRPAEGALEHPAALQGAALALAAECDPKVVRLSAFGWESRWIKMNQDESGWIKMNQDTCD